MRLYALPVVALAALLLASCAPKPVVVEVQQPHDSSLDCGRLAGEMQSAEFYKKAAKAEDRFRLRYIFIPTTIVAAYRMNNAESAAQDRLEYLQQLSQQRGCYAQGENMISPNQLESTYQDAPQEQYMNPNAGMPMPYPPAQGGMPMVDPYGAPQGYELPPAGPYGARSPYRGY